MDKKFDKWVNHLNIIKSEISELLVSQDIFRETQKIIKANTALDIPSSFWRYLRNTYVSHVMIGIRRQLKSDNQSISFIRLLEDMRANPQSFPRSYYHDIYKNTLVEDFTNKDFNRFAKANEDYICPDMVGDDINRLKKSAEKCEKFADKVVAHTDVTEPKDLPTFNELDESIKILDELYVKYHLLFHAQSMNTLMPTYQYDWTEIFKYAWIANSNT